MPDRPIVYAIEYYPPFGAGGAEYTTSLHARLLARAGRHVIVVTPNYGAAEQETIDGVEIHRFPFGRFTRLGQQASQSRFLDPRFHRRLAKAIEKAAAGRALHCIHAQTTTTVIGASLAAHALRVPLVTHIRDTSTLCLHGAACMMEKTVRLPPKNCGLRQNLACQGRLAARPKSRLKRAKGSAIAAVSFGDLKIRQRIFQRADRIAFASENVRKLYHQLDEFQDESKQLIVRQPLLLEPPQLGELPEGVRAAKEAGDPIFLYVGKVSKGKGCDVLFAAHRRLLASHPRARLVVAGNIREDGWEYDRERTIVLGFVDRSVLAGLYAACDVVMLPSTWPEPLGWPNLEAARFSKPIVATRVGGIPEAVADGETGILVEKLDDAAMARAMARLLDEPELARRMGAAARAHVLRTFGEDVVLAQLSRLYDGL